MKKLTDWWSDLSPITQDVLLLLVWVVGIGLALAV